MCRWSAVLLRGTDGLQCVLTIVSTVSVQRNSLNNKSHLIFLAARYIRREALAHSWHYWKCCICDTPWLWAMGNIKQLSNLDNILWRWRRKKRELQRCDGCYLWMASPSKIASALSFNISPCSLSCSFLWMRPGFLSHPAPELILEHRCWP